VKSSGCQNLPVSDEKVNYSFFIYIFVIHYSKARIAALLIFVVKMWTAAAAIFQMPMEKIRIYLEQPSCAKKIENLILELKYKNFRSP
jgi:hypothetical protein